MCQAERHPGPQTGPGLDSGALEDLQSLARATSEGCSVCIEPRLVRGNPSIEILAEAEHRHASLIVMGSTARSGFENLTHDRTVYKVLAHAHCPVLTLRKARVKAEDSSTTQLVTRT